MVNISAVDIGDPVFLDSRKWIRQSIYLSRTGISGILSKIRILNRLMNGKKGTVSNQARIIIHFRFPLIFTTRFFLLKNKDEQYDMLKAFRFQRNATGTYLAKSKARKAVTDPEFLNGTSS